MNTGASWPADSAYFIKLASITGGVITDERQFIKEMFFNLDVPLNQAPSIDIESATITDLSNMTGDSADITGTETIENFGTMPEGAIKYLTFQDILEIVHDDISNILPND